MTFYPAFALVFYLSLFALLCGLENTTAFRYRHHHHQELTTTKPTTNSRTLSCSFDRSLCGWTGNAFRIQPSTALHSSPSDTSYLYVQAEKEHHQNYFLNSTRVLLSEKTQLSFRYNIFHTKDLQSFGVHVIYPNESAKILWQIETIESVSDIPFNVWLPVRLDLAVTGPFYLRIEAGFTDGSTGKVGLDDLVLNREKSVITYDPPSDVIVKPVTSVPSITSITCSPDKDATVFCGWRTTRSVQTTVAVGTVDSLGSQGHDGGFNLFVKPSSDSVNEFNSTAIIQSSIFRPSKNAAEFSFWYRLQKGTTQLVLYGTDGNPYKQLLKLDPTIYLWKPVVIALPGAGVGDFQDVKELKFGFNVLFPAGSSSSNSYFALDNVWYSGEIGFEVDNQIDVLPVPVDESSTRTSNPTTETAGLSWVYIGLAIASGVLATLGIIYLAVYFYRRKRRFAHSQRTVTLEFSNSMKS